LKYQIYSFIRLYLNSQDADLFYKNKAVFSDVLTYTTKINN
jgi:hypothetical protein